MSANHFRGDGCLSEPEQRMGDRLAGLERKIGRTNRILTVAGASIAAAAAKAWIQDDGFVGYGVFLAVFAVAYLAIDQLIERDITLK